MHQLTDSDQASAIEWFRKHLGLSLTLEKKYLVETRLEPVAFEFGYGSVKALLKELVHSCSSDPNLVKSVCSAITTHETSFFRDHNPFQFLSDVYFPEWIEKNPGNAPWSAWSAACSSGQEIYSLAMLLEENFPEFLGRDISLHGTDISTHTLEKAASGEYHQAEISRGLPAHFLMKYFTQLANGNWQLDQKIRGLVEFEYHNLIGNWSERGQYDLILLRNVLIYFDVELKINVLSRIKHHLKPDGILLLGGSESTANLDPEWEICKSGTTVFYRLRSNGNYHP